MTGLSAAAAALMPDGLHPVVRAFFLHHAAGRIVLENAAAGVAIGLHAAGTVGAALKACDAAFRAEKRRRLSTPPVEEVGAFLTDWRFPPAPAPAGGSARPALDTKRGGECLPRIPDLGPALVATIRPIHQLPDIMAREDQDRLKRCWDVDFPPAARGADFSEAAERLMAVPRRERAFRLERHRAGGAVPGGRTEITLGWRQLWFTTHAAALAGLCDAPGRIGHRMRDSLGLVHRRKGEWLVLLTFPGEVVQRRGHRRPIFCDSEGNNRFMAGSSCRDHYPPSPWGQAADLAPIEGRHPKEVADFDGGPERVSAALQREDFGELRLHFHVLGRLAESRGGMDDDAAAAACDDFFAEGLAERNAARAGNGKGACA